MCLIDKKQFRIAEKDIPVFKIVENKFGKLQAPYQHLEYKTFPMLESLKNVEPTITQQNTFQYGYGFIHAYLTEEIANFHLNLLRSLPGSRVFILYKGYVPKGTRYAMNEYENICARKIILEL